MRQLQMESNSPNKMNMFTLPEEMIANVLKYWKFETVVRFRKINKKFDGIMVGYGINKPRVDGLFAYEYEFYKEHSVYVKYDMKNMLEKEVSPEEEGYQLEKVQRQRNSIEGIGIMSLIEYELDKIRQIGTFSLNNITLDDKWRVLLQNMRNSKKCNLEITSCVIRISIPVLVNILKKFKSSRINFNEERELLEGQLTSDQIICSLLPITSIGRSFYVSQKVLCPDVTDATLRMLQSTLPTMFVLENHVTSFTLKEILATLLVAKENKNILTDTHWNLGCLKVISARVLDRAVGRFQAIEECRVKIEPNEAKVWFISNNITIEITIFKTEEI